MDVPVERRQDESGSASFGINLCAHKVRLSPRYPTQGAQKSRFRLPRRVELFGQLSILSRDVDEDFLQFWIIGDGGMCFVVERIAQVFSRFVDIYPATTRFPDRRERNRSLSHRRLGRAAAGDGRQRNMRKGRSMSKLVAATEAG